MFEITGDYKGARTGLLHTAHGKVETPFFMPVSTKAVSKFIGPKEMEQAGVQCLIANAFVLHLIPGHRTIKRLGGIHRFMNFKGSIFTDSGGFQMYSQKFLISTNQEGVMFSDPINGGKVFCTPEKDMQIQLDIGSDVHMCLDSMPKHGASRTKVMDSMRKTYRWALRCKAYHDKHRNRHLLFGIAQGGIYPDLRELSSKKISSVDFDGYAFGGLALGEPQEEMFKAIKIGMKHMPANKPRYLMGVGVPSDILKSVEMGVDCFDSRFPTMNARHNHLFTMKGRMNIENRAFRHDESPIEEDCDCHACKNFSRAYLHHLARTKEAVGKIYNTIHNIRFMMRFMESIRTSITEGEFHKFRRRFLAIARKSRI